MKITFTSSFDANLHSPHNAGFFSSILRRLLCSGSLRTHPFDCVKDNSVVHRVEEKTEGSATPGIVARLMGLETMPELSYEPKANRTIKDLICRSRSANAVEYRSECDLSVEQRRRLKSSSSFREIPSFLQQEDDQFLVFSFENANKGKEQRRDDGNRNKENRMRTQEDSNKKNRRKKSGKRRRKISNGPSQSDRDCDRVHHSNSNNTNKKKDRRNVQASTKPKSPLGSRDKKGEERNSPSATEKAQLCSDTENSSPVSVLDLIEFVSEPESPISEDGSRLKGSNSRRKLSTHLATFEQLSSNSSHISITEVRELKNNNVQVTGSRAVDCDAEHYSAVWEEVSRLAGEDLQRSNWNKGDVSKIDGFEEIRVELGLQIMDQVLYELVEELV